MIIAIADTHAILRYAFANPRLTPDAKLFIDTAHQNNQQIGILSITFIEMVYLIEKQRIPLESLSRLARVISTASALFVEVPIDLQIARTLSNIDASQIADMPDRIIAATAVYFNVPLISRDGKIRLSNVTTIW